MPDWSFFESHAKEEWAVIYGAPVASLILVALAVITTGTILNLYYSERFKTTGLLCQFHKDRAEAFESKESHSKQPLIVAQATPTALVSYPDVSGLWRRTTDDHLKLEIKQTGFRIDSRFVGDLGHVHVLVGNYSEAKRKFVCVTTRTRSDGSGATEMYGSLEPLGSDTFEAEVIGTDGKGELPANYSEISTFRKILLPSV